MIEFEGKVFIEEDLVLNSDYPIINVVIEAYSYSGVQWHLEQWHEYRKAYRKVWGQDEIMRCSLINDPGIPYRVFKRYINDGYPYYG